MSERAILGPGERAPALALTAVDGERRVLAEALAAGPVLLAFFALDCQTCQIAFVHWDRAHEAYAGKTFRLWAVSLDGEPAARAFWEKSGVSFPVLVDDGSSVDAYRLVSTPAHVLVGEDGRVIASFDAFDRATWNAMLATVAERVGRAAIAVGPGEAPDFRAGCTVHG
ncbi:MAG: TlpA family protein disulfide reductase [Chloroflexi bacterium]|nr:TlpA family protein disulfide reductase [Chloroflexota bacterium]